MANKRRRSFADPESTKTREVKARTVYEDAAVDRLSDLPDDAILKIMSSVPTKEAVGTCVLSTRWKDVFTSLPDIDLDGRRLKNKALRNSFVNFVDGFLSSRKDISVDRFRIFCKGPGWFTRRVKEWIQYAEQHDVRELDVNIETISQLHIWIPSCERLEKLKLSISPSFIMSLPTNCCLPNLKVVHLTNLTFLVNEFITCLLLSCNSLEELLVVARGLCDERKLSICHPKLTRLTINGYMGTTLEIDTQNLVYFDYGFYTTRRHLFVNLNSLLEARIDIEFSSDEDEDTAPAIDLMRAISHVQSLHLTGYHSDVHLPESSDMIPKFPNLTYLKLGGDYAGWLNMLASCPYLETLAFEFEACDPIKLHVPKKVPSCLKHHIKIIKLTPSSESEMTSN